MTPMLWAIAMVLFTGVLVLASVPVAVMVERRGAAWIQRRTGPNRVGPWGLLQPLSDAVKLVFKEENIPVRAHKVLFILAPALAVIPPFVAFSLIPLSGGVLIGGQEYFVGAANLNVSLLFLLAITSLHVYSVLAAGWASNNKFSLMGALRSSSQMISYEIAIGITIVSLVMTYGTLDLREIVRLQEGNILSWGMFRQPVCLFVLWICSFAETNRLPFDLPEGESELVAGYHTEYSGLKFALFFMGEYAAMFLASAFMATLFLGGYNVPFVTEAALREFFAGMGPEMASVVAAGVQLVAFLAKMWFFMWVFIWVRWTLPRFRYDQLMDLGWKILLPVGIVNVMVTMAVQYFRMQGGA